jgi:hypothetical protein
VSKTLQSEADACCAAAPISQGQTGSTIAMCTGEDDQDVIGLHGTGGPRRKRPSVNVRFMGISELVIIDTTDTYTWRCDNQLHEVEHHPFIAEYSHPGQNRRS